MPTPQENLYTFIQDALTEEVGNIFDWLDTVGKVKPAFSKLLKARLERIIIDWPNVKKGNKPFDEFQDRLENFAADVLNTNDRLKQRGILQ